MPSVALGARIRGTRGEMEMRVVKDGKVYDTKTMETIVEKSDYHNGNYCGARWIGRTPRGNLAIVQTSNGQDLYRDSYVRPIEVKNVAEEIEGWKIDEDEQAKLVKIGAIEEA